MDLQSLVADAKASRRTWLEVLFVSVALEICICSNSTLTSLSFRGQTGAQWTYADRKLSLLQDHALQVLRDAVEKFEHPVFPCALIAGDVVILDLLARLGYLQNGKVGGVQIDDKLLRSARISPAWLEYKASYL